MNKYMIYPLYQNEEDVRKWLETRDLDDPNSYDLGFELKQTGELIGSGGLVYSPNRDVWKIGYNIRADQWGNGYAFEAICGIINYVSKSRTIRAIEGQFAEDNYKSKRVMEKLGMHYLKDSSYEKLDGSVRFASKVYIREF
ncbi:MAG: GNAT family N-acetyltransferase [Lachnospiraceae bacterium]|nr:GNAT family N-acetyltransferase [Lachnospiraceae bacterium]